MLNLRMVSSGGERGEIYVPLSSAFSLSAESQRQGLITLNFTHLKTICHFDLRHITVFSAMTGEGCATGWAYLGQHSEKRKVRKFTFETVATKLL